MSQCPSPPNWVSVVDMDVGLRSSNCCARFWRYRMRVSMLSSSWTVIVLAMILVFEIVLCEMSFQVDFNSLGVTASSWVLTRVDEVVSLFLVLINRRCLTLLFHPQ